MAERNDKDITNTMLNPYETPRCREISTPIEKKSLLSNVTEGVIYGGLVGLTSCSGALAVNSFIIQPGVFDYSNPERQFLAGSAVVGSAIISAVIGGIYKTIKYSIQKA